MIATDEAGDPYAARPWLASYPPGVPADIDESELPTLGAAFRRSVAAFGDRPAIKSFHVTLTYRELGEAAEAIASYLQARGLKKGERVAIMSPNVASYPAILYGVWLAGGVVVNVNPLYTPHELEHQIDDSGARFIFVLESFAHIVASAWPNMKVEQAIVTTPGDLLGLNGAWINIASRWIKRAVRPFSIPGAMSFKEALREGRRRVLAPVRGLARRHRAAAIYGRDHRPGQGRGPASSQCREQHRTVPSVAQGLFRQAPDHRHGLAPLSHLRPHDLPAAWGQGRRLLPADRQSPRHPKLRDNVKAIALHDVRRRQHALRRARGQ